MKKQKSELCKYIMYADEFVKELKKMIIILEKQRKKAQEEAYPNNLKVTRGHKDKK